MFKEVDIGCFGKSHIVYHEETKVMYAISDNGVFTVLVNPDRSPMIYRENEVVDIDVRTEEYNGDYYIYKEGNRKGYKVLFIDDMIALLEEAKRLKGNKVVMGYEDVYSDSHAPVSHICVEGDTVKIYTGKV